MHQPGVDVAGPYQTAVNECDGKCLAQPLADLVDRPVRAAAAPRHVASREAVREHQRLDGDQQVHRGEGHLAHVPADLARWHA